MIIQCPIQRRRTDFTDNKPLLARDNDFHNFRQYQYMLSIFSNNFNQTVKMLKDCLGQMQSYPKYSVSKQIQEQSQRLLSQCYKQILYKLSKQCLGRNEAIIKRRKVYSQQYYGFVGQSPNIQNQQNRKDDASFFELGKLLMVERQKQQRLLPKDHRRKTISTTPNNERFAPQIQIFKGYQVNLSSAVIAKTVASYHSEPHQYFIRATRSNISRTQRERSKKNIYQSPQNIKQQQEQVQQRNRGQLVFLAKEITSQPNPAKRVRPTQKKYTNYCSQSTSSSKIHFNDDTILTRENQKKAINQIEQLHLQTKNFQISNYGWSNFSQAQSYRPKVKRWQRNFN